MPRGLRHAAAFLLGSALSIGALSWQLGLPALPQLAHASATLAAPPAPVKVAEPPPVVPAQDLRVEATQTHPGYTLFAPEGPLQSRPTLVVLHGIGGNGPGMGSLMAPFAREEGWVVIAPTMPYTDAWRDPLQLTGEELRLLPQLANLLDSVEMETGVPIAEQVSLFGFSRGAQMALRFSLFYPERVDGVAAFSAGTYTLPVATIKTASGATVAAPLPYGTADVEQWTGHAIDRVSLTGVRFLIGVGAIDNREGDVPRQWDPFVGNNRLERAQRFAAALQQGAGCQTEFVAIPGMAHEVNGAVINRVSDFLRALATNPHPARPDYTGPVRAI